MRTSSVTAIASLLLALSLWALFGYFVWILYGERAEYVVAETSAREMDVREQSTSRLRATVNDTEVERASLESLLDVTILRAVEILESTGRQAGATSVTIGEATPQSLVGTSPNNLSAVSVVVNLQGSFTSVMRAISLYETLTMPSTVEQFEMEKLGGAWRATVRVRLLLASDR